jgi:hypothetical protein
MTGPPELIFIVPYRDREQQRDFYLRHMTQTVMATENPEKYKIYFSHQQDTRSFNRGAMKNIGFLAMKQMYPDHYQNITFVFNDLDTMPFTANFLNYRTTAGVIKHFYGFQFALGGIVSITGGDFEQLNGFPNYWAWGYEDNLLNIRANQAGLTIDRSQFYPIMDKNILQLKDGLVRLVNKKEFSRYLERTEEGLSSIQNLRWSLDEAAHFIHVVAFKTEFEEDKQFTHLHDLRKGPRPFTPASMKSLEQAATVVKDPIPPSFLYHKKRGKGMFMNFI